MKQLERPCQSQHSGGYRTWVIVWAAILLGAVASFGQHQNLDSLLSREELASSWNPVHADIAMSRASELKVRLWKGYLTTGVETAKLPVSDWSGWKSLKFDVRNPYPVPISAYVRVSGQDDQGSKGAFTGGTFDGFVIGPGNNTVDIDLAAMKSRDGTLINLKRIASLGLYFSPLYIRDGQVLKFRTDTTLQVSNLRLDSALARTQVQPYGDLLFKATDPSLVSKREEVETSIRDLQLLIARAQHQGIDSREAEIYPFLADMLFRRRLVSFWQDRVEMQRQALDFLLRGSAQAAAGLHAALLGKQLAKTVPPVPAFDDLSIKEGYFRQGDEPKLLYGMIYNCYYHEESGTIPGASLDPGRLLRWFANSEVDYGHWLVGGAYDKDPERWPIWEAYNRYPDTHRVGWSESGHIIRDPDCWEMVCSDMRVCLESPHTREANARMIEQFERMHAGDRQTHLLQQLGFEYTYVCYCEATRKMWRDWLQRKHATIEAANHIWQTNFADFDQVPMPRPEDASSNRALWYDWSEFNQFRFLEHISWTHDQVRRWEPAKPLSVGSSHMVFTPSAWEAEDHEALTDSGITEVVEAENYALNTMLPEYLHSIAGKQPVYDFEYHGETHQVLTNFLHGLAGMSYWWWADAKRLMEHEPINEWATSFPQSYVIPLEDVAGTMRDALDLRRLNREIVALAIAPRPVVLLYSKASMLQHNPIEADEVDDFPYLAALRQTYNESQCAGLYLGFTTEKRILAGDLTHRKVLVLSATQYVPQAVVDEILRWVQGGGTLIVSPDSLLSDEYARPSKVMSSLGLDLIRRSPAPFKRGETFVTEYNRSDLPLYSLSVERPTHLPGLRTPLMAIGPKQVLRCERRLIVAHFADGKPALVRIPKGHGVVYWLAAPLAPESWPQFLAAASEGAGIARELTVVSDSGGPLPDLEYRVTDYGQGHLAYFYNGTPKEVRFVIRPRFSASEVIDRRNEKQVTGSKLALNPWETSILEFR